jgi:glycosyltransferase involved in cell wall biosynthesis
MSVEITNPFEIDVIIPTYNREHMLERAVESVTKQKYPAKNLWIIDDGSTDKTSELIDELTKKFSELAIHSIKTENHGVSAARNLALEKSTAPWVAFLDSDDEWLENRLKLQVEYLEKHPQVELVHGEEIWLKNGKRINQKAIHQKSGGKIFERCLQLCLISPSATLVKRSLLDEVGHFREDFPVCEDYDLWLRITHGHDVGFISEPIIKKHGGHSGQLSIKYVAMDYWRVKSMTDLLERNVLSPSDELALRMELKKKASILLNGYLKHKNFDDYDEVKEYYELAIRGLPPA